MNLFLATISVILTMECLAKLVLLVLDIKAQSTRGSLAFDIAFDFALVAWALVLLLT